MSAACAKAGEDPDLTAQLDDSLAKAKGLSRSKARTKKKVSKSAKKPPVKRKRRKKKQ